MSVAGFHARQHTEFAELLRQWEGADLRSLQGLVSLLIAEDTLMDGAGLCRHGRTRRQARGLCSCTVSRASQCAQDGQAAARSSGLWQTWCGNSGMRPPLYLHSFCPSLSGTDSAECKGSLCHAWLCGFRSASEGSCLWQGTWMLRRLPLC
jgi:hypothetical protein